jgi:RNA ligase
MNKELTDLFEGLNKLCAENEAFYFSEQDYNEKYVVRSYTYRLASWSDFKLPYAKECRGTAFAYNKETKEWSLFCRAYPKFFNLGEGVPTEEYIAVNTPVTSFEKLDGSLILFGIIDGEVVAKSKTSINSDHAQMANKLISENEKLRIFIETSLDEGYTPVFELVGPDFKIVLNYIDTELVFLGHVNHNTGNVFIDTISVGDKQFFLDITGVRAAEMYYLSWEELLTIQETSKPHIEGFVVLCDNDEFVKVKVQSYVSLHHLKDDINNLTNLIPLILEDSLDDIMGQFQDDQVTLDYISEVQEKIAHKFNH